MIEHNLPELKESALVLSDIFQTVDTILSESPVSESVASRIMRAIEDEEQEAIRLYGRAVKYDAYYAGKVGGVR